MSLFVNLKVSLEERGRGEKTKYVTSSVTIFDQHLSVSPQIALSSLRKQPAKAAQPSFRTLCTEDDDIGSSSQVCPFLAPFHFWIQNLTPPFKDKAFPRHVSYFSISCFSTRSPALVRTRPLSRSPRPTPGTTQTQQFQSCSTRQDNVACRVTPADTNFALQRCL